MLQKDLDSVVDLFDCSVVDIYELHNLATSEKRQCDEEKSTEIYVICNPGFQ